MTLYLALLLVLADGTTGADVASGAAAPASEAINLNQPCAATSLYVLLDLYGRRPDFKVVLNQVGPDSKALSAEKLCEAAAHFGLPLRAVELSQQDVERLEKPWIAFMQPCAGTYAGTGHYVNIRYFPDSKRVQFIDPPGAPQVAPVDMLFSGGWCRIALVPEEAISDSRGHFNLIVCASALAGIGLTLTWLRRMQGRPQAAASS